MTSTPTPPDQSHDATDLGNGGNLSNPQAPSRVVVGFPSASVAKLREYEWPSERGRAAGGRVLVDADCLGNVLAWIDRYVPQSLVGSEETLVVDGIRELRFNGDEALLDMLDLVRVNGRPFVPEVPLAVGDGEVVIDGERFVRLDHDLPIEEAVSIIVKGRRFVPETPAVVEDACCSDCHGTGDTGLGFHHVCGRCAGTGREPTVPVRHPEWPLTPPVNHEAANRERAGVIGKIEPMPITDHNPLCSYRSSGGVKPCYYDCGRGPVQ